MSGYPYTLRTELHKALEDAGIDFWMAQGLTFWNCEDGRECVAYGYQSDDGPRLAMKIVGLTTPEQAIEATFDYGRYERKMDALLCRLTNGKFSKTRTYDLDFMESVVREEFETECVSEPGTCQMKLLWYNIDAGAFFECSECGGIVSTFGPEPRFCSKCGCRVEAVVK